MPADATNEEALAWVNRMRHVANWWDELPEFASQSIPPELRKQAHEELDTLERMVRENMAGPETA
jgi:hypothetical protein